MACLVLSLLTLDVGEGSEDEVLALAGGLFLPETTSFCHRRKSIYTCTVYMAWHVFNEQYVQKQLRSLSRLFT